VYMVLILTSKICNKGALKSTRSPHLLILAF
jgi:hypothetical protein